MAKEKEIKEIKEMSTKMMLYCPRCLRYREHKVDKQHERLCSFCGTYRENN